MRSRGVGNSATDLVGPDDDRGAPSLVEGDRTAGATRIRFFEADRSLLHQVRTQDVHHGP
jgi:hypothetical protein